MKPTIENVLLAGRNEHIKSISLLQELPSIREQSEDYLGSGNNITLRNNTTTIIADMLKWYNDGYQIIYSNIESPSIINAIEIFVPEESRICLNLMDCLLSGDIEKIEASLSKQVVAKSIYIFSHVLWSTGIRLNVFEIASNIKSASNEHIIIVDGAQAVGNLDNLNTHIFKDGLIDFYVSCIHKWMNVPAVMGFAVINSKFIKEHPNFVDQLFAKDLFSKYAGKYSGFKSSHCQSTYDCNLALKVTIALKKAVENPEIGPDYKAPIIKNKSLLLIPNSQNRIHKFFGVYGKLKDVQDYVKKYGYNKHQIVRDRILPKGYVWLRIGLDQISQS